MQSYRNTKPSSVHIVLEQKTIITYVKLNQIKNREQKYSVFESSNFLMKPVQRLMQKKIKFKY